MHTTVITKSAVPVTCNAVKLRAVAPAALVIFRLPKCATSMVALFATPRADFKAAPSAADIKQLGSGAVPEQ